MKRITVSVDDNQALILADISKLTGVSVSSIIRELVSTSTPMFKELINHLEIARESQDKAEKIKNNFYESVKKTMTDNLSGVQGQINLMGNNENEK